MTSDPRDPEDRRPDAPDDGTPRIYVASLSDYNAGTLHGRWIDAAQSAEDIQAEVSEMLAESPEAATFPQGGPAEEWAIHDFDGFGTIRLSEYESFETVAELAAAIVEHGAGPVSAYYGNVGSWSESDFQDSYAGEWESLGDYAQELAEDITEAARFESWPFTCIDWERAGRELDMGGDIWTADADYGRVHVFRTT